MLKFYVLLSTIFIWLFNGYLLAGQISGIVTDGEDNPVSEAYVSAMGFDYEKGDSVFYSTRSGADGTFILDNLMDGEYYVRAVTLNEWISDLAGPYHVRDTTNIVDLKLVVYDPYKDTGSISGKVETYEQLPVSDARIIIQEQFKFWTFHTNSDGAGNYHLQRVSPGQYNVLVYHPQGFIKEYSELVKVGIKEDVGDINIVFTKEDLSTGSIIGSVKTSEGDPLNDVKVYANPSVFGWGSSDSGFVSITDEFGQYSFEDLVPGNYQIYSIHPSGSYKALDNAVEVTGGQETAAPDIIYPVHETITGFVTGKVTIGADAPAAGASISFYPTGHDSAYLYSNHVYSDGTGHYQASMAPGIYFVVCEYRDDQIPYFIQYYDKTFDFGSATTIEVTADQTTANIDFLIPEPVILPEVEISGIVKDEEGESIEAAKIELIYSSNGIIDSTFFPKTTTITNSEGEYSFSLKNINSATAKIIVSAAAEGYIREFYDNKKEFYLADILAPDEDHTVFDDINFTLERIPSAINTSIRGVVKNEGGSPISGAEVIGYHVDNEYITSSRTESDGKYILDHLYEGKYVILFYAPGYIPEYYDNKNYWDEADQLDAAESHINIDAVLTEFESDSSSKKITGRITSEEGQKVGGVFVLLEDETGRIIGFDFSDKLGNYQINRRADGNLSMNVNRVQYQRKTDVVKVADLSPELIIRNIVMKKINSTTELSDQNENNALPNDISLAGNWPNPFNPETTIRYALSGNARVSVVIYDILGREVRKLVDKEFGTGIHNVKWQGNDKNGTKVNSGLYIYQISAHFKNGWVSSKSGKMIMVK